MLLIIFMVTRPTSCAVDRGDLPRAAHGGESVGVMLNIVLTKDAKIFVDGVEGDEAALGRKVAEALAKDKDARAIISADKNALHGSVVRVIDLIKGAGIAKFAINIEKDVTAN